MFLATLLQKDRLYVSQLFVSRRPRAEDSLKMERVYFHRTVIIASVANLTVR